VRGTPHPPVRGGVQLVLSFTFGRRIPHPSVAEGGGDCNSRLLLVNVGKIWAGGLPTPQWLRGGGDCNSRLLLVNVVFVWSILTIII